MKRNNILKLVQLAMLVAIIFVLQITGVGFILIPPISITTLVIPVIVGAIIIGPGAGAVLGAVFGGLSMWTASTAAAAPMDLAFSPFLSGSPVASIILCLGTRILFGFLTGVLYKAFKKLFHNITSARTGNNISVILSSAIGVAVHTASVMACLWLLFPSLGVEFKAVVSAVASLNFLAEAGMAIVFAVALANIVPVLTKKKI